MNKSCQVCEEFDALPGFDRCEYHIPTAKIAARLRLMTLQNEKLEGENKRFRAASRELLGKTPPIDCGPWAYSVLQRNGINPEKL